MVNKKISFGKTLHLRLIFARFYKLITTVLVILIVGGGYFVVLEPRFRESGQGNKVDLNLIKAELLKRQQHLEQLQTLIENYNKISPAEIARIKMILPRDQDIPGLFVQFQELATKNNLLLGAINFNDAPATSGSAEIKKISINVDLVSSNDISYQEIKKFIASVETNLRLLDIDSVFFTPDSTNYSLTIIAYYY